MDLSTRRLNTITELSTRNCSAGYRRITTHTHTHCFAYGAQCVVFCACVSGAYQRDNAVSRPNIHIPIPNKRWKSFAFNADDVRLFFRLLMVCRGLSLILGPLYGRSFFIGPTGCCSLSANGGTKGFCEPAVGRHVRTVDWSRRRHQKRVRVQSV